MKFMKLAFSVVISYEIYKTRHLSCHIIWNLWNSPSQWSFHMNFIKLAESEFHKFHLKWPRVCDSVYHMTIKNGILSPSKWTLFQLENALLAWTCQWLYMYAPKCYYTCGYTIFMTRWMDGWLAILRPFQQYFIHIRTMSSGVIW